VRPLLAEAARTALTSEAAPTGPALPTRAVEEALSGTEATPPVLVVARGGEGGATEAAEQHRDERHDDERRQRPGALVPALTDRLRCLRRCFRRRLVLAHASMVRHRPVIVL
jgi:hypothetical protein